MDTNMNDTDAIVRTKKKNTTFDFTKYAREHKDTIYERQRNRYANNPELRERKRALMRAYSKKRRQEAKKSTDIVVDVE